MKQDAEKDRLAYQLAKGYLPGLGIDGVTPELIERYLNPSNLNARPKSKEELYFRLLLSAQNAQMMPRVIGDVRRLAPVLYEFNPERVLINYGDDWQSVLDRIERDLKPVGQIRKTQKSIWPRYCRTILSSAKFIEQFESAEDFFEWADFFNRDERARASLPLIMSQEIDGLGFALSCDFLKENGYANFPKPDVHLRDIFTELELCDEKDPYHLFKSIIRVARNSNVTPYNADKVFWLIGSGYFYRDAHIGSKGRIGSHKKDFIAYARPKILKVS